MRRVLWLLCCSAGLLAVSCEAPMSAKDFGTKKGYASGLVFSDGKVDVAVDAAPVKLNFRRDPVDAPVTKVTWKVDNPRIATVDEHGVLTPVHAGSTRVEATIETVDGSQKGDVLRVSVWPRVTTIAGKDGGYAEGSSSVARFSTGFSVAPLADGGAWIVDWGNGRIRRIGSDGATQYFTGDSTFGTKDGWGVGTKFYNPKGLARGSDGSLYVADSYNYAIRKISPSGVVSTLAGTPGSSGTIDGQGTAARFTLPSSLVMSSQGDLFVTDGYKVRKVTADGLVSTLAGNGWGSQDGTGASAQFASPTGIAIDPSGNLYVADGYNAVIRKVTQQGEVSTIAGLVGQFGSIDGGRSVALFSAYLTAVCYTTTGDLVVSDGARLRRVSLSGTVTTLAGSASSGNVDGSGTAARFSTPAGIAEQSDGTFAVTDGDRIRKVTSAGVVTTLAGRSSTSQENWITYRDGPVADALFAGLYGITVEPSGRILVVDTNNHRIRAVNTDAVVSTEAGSGAYGYRDGTGTGVGIGTGRWAVADGQGNLFFTNTSSHGIRKMTPAGVVSTIAGSLTTRGHVDGATGVSRFNDPGPLAVDADGNIFVGDRSNHAIRKISAAGVVTTLAGGGEGRQDGVGTQATFEYPTALSLLSTGVLLIADSTSQWPNGYFYERTLSPDGAVKTLIGNGYGYYYGTLTADRDDVIFWTGNELKSETLGWSFVQNGAGYADGAGPTVKFYSITQLAPAPDGSIWAVDNAILRKIVTRRNP